MAILQDWLERRLHLHRQLFTGAPQPTAGPTFDSSDKYTYANVQLFLDGQRGFAPFTRMGNGGPSLNLSFTEKDPAPDTTLPFYLQTFPATADQHEHLALSMLPCYNRRPCSPYPVNIQLASHTVNTTAGGISSTNTQDTAPFLGCLGQLRSACPATESLSRQAGQEFRFLISRAQRCRPNSAPVKISGVRIDRLVCDKDGHLYALSYEAQELYVFHVSAAKGVVEIGEPMLVSSSYGLTGIIVVDT
jgi:hypothetical protein